MKIVFFGTPEFAGAILKELLESGGHEVAAVVTRADKPVGRKQVLTPPPVKAVFNELCPMKPALQPARLKTGGFSEELKKFGADIGVVAAYGRILPKEALEAFTYGCINVHGSILPKYRGASPVQSAVINGDSETGVTVMQMDEGLDTGDIILIKKTNVRENETSGDLFRRLAAIGAEALKEALGLIERGQAAPVKQNSDYATYTKQLKKEDGIIEWKQNARNIVNRINGLNPWPGAYIQSAGGEIKLWRAEYIGEESPPLEPGTVKRADKKNGLVIQAVGGAVKITEIQARGGKRLAAADFLNGVKIAVGEAF